MVELQTASKRNAFERGHDLRCEPGKWLGINRRFHLLPFPSIAQHHTNAVLCGRSSQWTEAGRGCLTFHGHGQERIVNTPAIGSRLGNSLAPVTLIRLHLKADSDKVRSSSHQAEHVGPRAFNLDRDHWF